MKKHTKVCVKIQIPKGTPGTYISEVVPERPEYEILMLDCLKLKRIKWNLYKIE